MYGDRYHWWRSTQWLIDILMGTIVSIHFIGGGVSISSWQVECFHLATKHHQVLLEIKEEVGTSQSTTQRWKIVAFSQIAADLLAQRIRQQPDEVHHKEKRPVSMFLPSVFGQIFGTARSLEVPNLQASRRWHPDSTARPEDIKWSSRWIGSSQVPTFIDLVQCWSFESFFAVCESFLETMVEACGFILLLINFKCCPFHQRGDIKLQDSSVPPIHPSSDFILYLQSPRTWRSSLS